VKKTGVISFLSFIDPMVLKVAEPKRTSRRTEFSTRAIWSRPLIGGLRLILGVLYLGDAKQAFCGDAALSARALHVVDARKNPLARYADPHSICSDLGARERVDDLGTEISCTRDRSRLGPNLPGTSDYRW